MIGNFVTKFFGHPVKLESNFPIFKLVNFFTQIFQNLNFQNFKKLD